MADKQHNKCLICGFEAVGKKLSNHINKEHKLKTEDYTIQCVYNGIRPLCKECGSLTRYVQFSFKKYCKEHSFRAESEAGKIGGSRPAWSKGLTKNDDQRLMNASIRVMGRGNHFYGKKHSETTIDKIRQKKQLSMNEIQDRLKNSNGNWEYIDENQYNNMHQYMNFKCSICGVAQVKSLFDIERGAACQNCDAAGTSLPEKEIARFIESLDVSMVRNTRQIISPKELDIFIPDYKLAIEYHGLYWHSRDDKDKKSHFIKWKECNDKGIKLIQFFSDEWRDKQEICKSIIKHALNKTENKIHARKCSVVQIDARTASTLLNSWHLDGYVRSIAHFGLMYNDEVVSIVTLRKPFHRKHVQSNAIEISRFATKLNTVVVGGLSKLMKSIIVYAKQNNYTTIMSYADLRLGCGNTYKQTDFVYDGHTGVNYWHTDGYKRYNRFLFKADKKNGLTEKQVCELAGVKQITGPGNYRFIYKVH